MLLAVGITIYGGILRWNVITCRYGPLDHPGWARVLTTRVSPLARYVEPGIYAWPQVANPYVGGDPINYLRFGREMQSFYQAHVREPVFPAITRVFLILLDNQDVAVSFASALTSTLSIFATYLLGRAAFGAPVGLLAAFGLAIDYDAVSWAADGWRDDTFTLFVVLGAWAFVRLRQDPRPRNAVIAGVLAGGACLTRITSLSWIVPALLFLGLERRSEWRQRLVLSGIAAAVTAAVVAPYLINCWRATGDPFMSINVHTGYYRASEGLPSNERMNALSYVRAKLARKPVFQLDTAITGLFVYPIRNKWSGFDLWVPRLTQIVMTLGIVGLVLFLGSAVGRLLLLITFSSLIPYGFTWNVGGGGEWRFTMHIYPLLLIAAAYAAVWLVRAALRLPRLVDTWPPAWSRRTVMRVTAACVLAVLACLGYVSLPYFVARESLDYGEPTSISTGERDWLFYPRGWSPWRQDGMVTARVMLGERGTIRIPVPRPRPYLLTVRADPATPELPRRIVLLMNGRLLFRFGLGWDPERVGAYSIEVAPEFLRSGANELQLVADGVVQAGAAGPRYAWLPPSTPISLRVWYVRLNPL